VTFIEVFRFELDVQGNLVFAPSNLVNVVFDFLGQGYFQHEARVGSVDQKTRDIDGASSARTSNPP
jgi:hypothetical protein